MVQTRAVAWRILFSVRSAARGRAVGARGGAAQRLFAWWTSGGSGVRRSAIAAGTLAHLCGAEREYVRFRDGKDKKEEGRQENGSGEFYSYRNFRRLLARELPGIVIFTVYIYI